MFNRSFDLVAAVRNMPLSVRKHVLLSLVGSVNASIVGGADKLATQLEAIGYTLDELREFEPREVVWLMQNVDFQGDVGGDKLRKLAALGHVLRGMLLQTDHRNAGLGSIAGTIDMMVGTQRLRPVSNNAVALLEAVGVKVTAAQIEETRAQRRDLDQQRANARAKRRGFIEWVIDNCFNREQADGEDADVYGDLDEDVREQLCNKALAAMSKGVTTATQNVLMGVSNSDALGICDIALLKGLHAQLMSDTGFAHQLSEAYRVEAPKPVDNGPSNKVRRVRKVKPSTEVTSS